MTFNSFDAVFFTVAFLVPGFVWESVLHMFLRRREDRADRVWVRLLTLSALNFEQIYKIEDDDFWQPVPMNRGVWIRGEAIRTIELLAFQE